LPWSKQSTRREFVSVVKCRVQGHIILQATDTDLARGQSLEPFAVIDLPAARAIRQHGCQQLAAANDLCALFPKCVHAYLLIPRCAIMRPCAKMSCRHVHVNDDVLIREYVPMRICVTVGGSRGPLNPGVLRTTRCGCTGFRISQTLNSRTED
jgi:hypothetical protein